MNALRMNALRMNALRMNALRMNALRMNAFELRRGAERGHLVTDWLEARFSLNFDAWRRPDRGPFSALLVLNEDRVQPGTGFPMHPHRDLEILMVPLEGVIEHRDSLGGHALVQPDEVMYMAAGTGILHSQMNPHPRTVDRHLQIWLRPLQAGKPPRVEKRLFPRPGREGRWQLLACAHGHGGSLRIDQDAQLRRARLAPGSSLLYAGDRPDRSAYLHLIDGEIALVGDPPGAPQLLRGGDAAAWPRQQPFSVLARGEQPAELLLLDLPAA